MALPTNLTGEIEPGQWRESYDRLLSVGASTCLILAAHNSYTHKGLMGHFSNLVAPRSGITTHEAEFQQAVDTLPKLGRITHTDIWLGGAAPFIEEDTDTNVPNRDKAAEVIQEYLRGRRLSAERHLTIDWSEPGMVIDAQLFCRRDGALVIDRYPEMVEPTS